MDKRVIEELSPNFGFFYKITEELHREQTSYQDLRIVSTNEFGKVMLLDGFTQVGERKHFQYHELIVDAPLLAHPEPEKILIIGGGDGGVDRHILRHPSIQHVDHIEIDEVVTERAIEFLPTVSAGALDDKRVHLRFEDGKTFVEQTQQTYDVIIMDLTDPIGPAAELYTEGFLRQLKQCFRDERSVLSLHTTSPIINENLFTMIMKTLEEVFDTVMTFYNYIQMYGTLWSVSVVGGAGFQKPKKPMIEARLGERKLNLDLGSPSDSQLNSLMLLNPESYFSLQTRLPYITRALSQPAQIAKTSSDLISLSS